MGAGAGAGSGAGAAVLEVEGLEAANGLGAVSE